jgi:sulfatase maturation enzyme AslB (radical SAM superfamily)
MREILKDDWLRTPGGDSRGYIESTELTEVWFHTGTNCNLSCPFCLEGSKPGDDRLNFLTLDDVVPFLEEAVAMGCQKFSFTGGEPFVNPHFVDILGAALDRLPCLVLTNGTEPLRNRFAEVVGLQAKAHDVSFRVSLDHPDPSEHDASRGKGNFKMALRTLGQLHEAGFHVSIARLMLEGEDSPERDAGYVPFFQEAGLPDDMTIINFPDFMTPGAMASVPHITEGCMTQYTNEAQRAAYMCSFSRMVVKAGGRIGVYACTLVDDDGDYDLARTLRESMQVRIRLKHHRCYSCFAYGSSCSEGH